MANSFLTEVQTGIGTTPVNIYTCPAGTSTTIIGMTLSNISVVSPIYVNVILDATGRLSGGENSVYIIKDAPIPTGGALIPIGGDQKIVLEPGDIIKVSSDTASSVDVVLSHLDIT